MPMSTEAGVVATREVAKRKRSAKSTVTAETRESSGTTSYFNSEKQGRKGLGKKLKKYATYPSINVSMAEMSTYLNTYLPNSVVNKKLDTQQSTTVKSLKDTLWLSLEKNILFYGYGYKKPLLDAIVNEHLMGEDVLFIDGIGGIGCVKALLRKICANVNGEDWSALGIVLNAKHLVAGQHAHSRPRLYIVVHDIGALQSREAQWVLSILAECPSVCMIGSLDHMNTTLLWDDEMLVRFNWVFKHSPTFRHHPIPDDFVFFHSNALISTGGRSGLLHVLASLTMKHRELFEVLCESILKAGASRMLRSELLEALRRKMTARDAEELRQLLKEFLDHDVIQEVSVNKKDYLSVDLPESELRNFLTKKSEGYFS